jgi:hypothetical protein
VPNIVIHETLYCAVFMIQIRSWPSLLRFCLPSFFLADKYREEHFERKLYERKQKVFKPTLQCEKKLMNGNKKKKCLTFKNRASYT